MLQEMLTLSPAIEGAVWTVVAMVFTHAGIIAACFAYDSLRHEMRKGVRGGK